MKRSTGLDISQHMYNLIYKLLAKICTTLFINFMKRITQGYILAKISTTRFINFMKRITHGYILAKICTT